MMGGNVSVSTVMLDTKGGCANVAIVMLERVTLAASAVLLSKPCFCSDVKGVRASWY